MWRIAGVLLVLVLAATPVAYRYGRATAAPLPPPSFVAAPVSGPPSAAAGTSVVGDCNAVGNGNTVSCGRLSMDNVEVSDATTYYVWFDGRPSDLPTPPAAGALNYPCADWYPWLRSQPGFYFSGPSKVITLSAGEPDLVTLTDAKLMITKRTTRAERDGIYIQCNWGGGSHKSYRIYIDTLKSRTTLRTNGVDGEGPAQRMPPAAIALGDVAQADAEIMATSVPGHLYEGILVVTVSRNGKTEKLTIGTPEEPLRWIATKAGGAVDDMEKYGWDPGSSAWVKDYNPLAEGPGD